MEYKINASTGAIVIIEDEPVQEKLISFITSVNMQVLLHLNPLA